MKKISIILFVLSSIISISCSTTKKGATSKAVTAESSSTPMVLAPTIGGIYIPGNEELVAIQSQYKDATLQQLQEGHAIYTIGACIKCHGANNIYEHETSQWKEIIDDMAQKAYLSSAQKDAVYKYVLAIKAKQPK